MEFKLNSSGNLIKENAGPNVMLSWLEVQLHTRGVLGSNVGLTLYIDPPGQTRGSGTSLKDSSIAFSVFTIILFVI
jgi:hypothetical protein